ncbi:MAG: hypothetical protein J5848_03590, partial [Bacteroidales bacterium]|nr:hypothetical protein [Bacteroidales bacterium]
SIRFFKDLTTSGVPSALPTTLLHLGRVQTSLTLHSTSAAPSAAGRPPKKTSYLTPRHNYPFLVIAAHFGMSYLKKVVPLYRISRGEKGLLQGRDVTRMDGRERPGGKGMRSAANLRQTTATEDRHSKAPIRKPRMK